jgi:type I restriction enzyme S subunit
MPLIATNCIRNDLLYPSYDSQRYVSQDTYASWFRGHPEPGDLIFVTKGTPGRVCIAPDPVDFCIAQDMVAVRADDRKIYPKYLFAVLRSPDVQAQIESMHVGTMIPHFKKGDFDKLIIPVPARKIQELIGDIYYTLSDKIELNRQMNRTLEAMAQALFKSWFVDFDPVHAKEEGRVPYGMDGNTAALFPQEFEYSELGEIPKGWKVKTLGELCDAGTGSVQTGPFGSQLHAADYVTDGVPVVMPVNLGDNRIIEEGISRVSTKMRDNLSRHVLSKGDIVFARRGDIGRKAYVRERESGWLCGTGCLRIRLGDSPLDSLNLSHWLGQEKIKESLISQAVGTTMPNLNTSILRSILVLIPSSTVQNRAAETLHDWDDLVASNDAANQTLASLRDLLLPKLVSGEILVRQAENLVAEAV